MSNRTQSPKSASSALLALFSGLLPWFAGLFVIATRNLLWLAVVGVLVCMLSTTGMYLLRKSYGRKDVTQWAIAEPFLFGCYYVVSAVLIRYVFIRG